MYMRMDANAIQEIKATAKRRAKVALPQDAVDFVVYAYLNRRNTVIYITTKRGAYPRNANLICEVDYKGVITEHWCSE